MSETRKIAWLISSVILTNALIWSNIGPSMLGPTALAHPANDPGWVFTGSLNTRRSDHTATLLPNGKVLVAGGKSGASEGILNSAELYDPATGTWSLTGSLNVPRYHFTATLLTTGKVLVAGGISDPSSITAKAELYDPAAGTWSLTGDLNEARFHHSATLLRNGKVLIAGGHGGQDGARRSAELYDPASGTWSVTGSLFASGRAGRMVHTATLLQNGKVLVAGGGDGDEEYPPFFSAELYNPETGTWSSASSLSFDRAFHTATLLQNGKVLVVGGSGANIAELYDPATNTWSHGGTLSLRSWHTATLLPRGQVLITGGANFGNPAGLSSLDSADLYDPHTGMWSNTASLRLARYSHTATPLENGKVLIVGGFNSTAGILDSAELYDPGTSTTPNPIDDPQFFVRQHYIDFLAREPDAGGLAYWTNEITQCGSDTACINARRIAVSASFFIEQEFQETGYFVYRFYKASFGRQPNYSEFTSDRSGLIIINLEASKQAFANEWVQRPAFVAAYPLTMSNTQFVNKLFDFAGLTASRYDALRQQEIAAMNAGRSRALVLRDVIEIPDFRNIPDPNDARYSELKQTSQYNPAFVLMQYFGYLDRDVDPPGYAFWLDVVNNREPNNYRGLVCSFITSREYQLRFGSEVTRTNADCDQ